MGWCGPSADDTVGANTRRERGARAGEGGQEDGERAVCSNEHKILAPGSPHPGCGAVPYSAAEVLEMGFLLLFALW